MRPRECRSWQGRLFGGVRLGAFDERQLENWVIVRWKGRGKLDALRERVFNILEENR